MLFLGLVDGNCGGVSGNHRRGEMPSDKPIGFRPSHWCKRHKKLLKRELDIDIMMMEVNPSLQGGIVMCISYLWHYIS